MLLEKGFDDYISKPVETHKLTALMDKWTPSRLRRYKQKDLSPENKGEPGLAAGKNDKEIQREKERKLPEGFSLSEAMEAALDVNLGLRRCGGSPKNYLSLLSVFMKDALATEKELYLPEPGQEDLPLIATRIHAIKSAAASLGAEALSKEAAFLEERARIGDIETLRRGRLEAFRRDLSALAAGLKEALDRFNSQNRLEEIPLGIDGLILLKEAVAGKKIREIDSLIARYSQSCGTDGRAALESLSGLILIGDFIQAESYLEGLIKNIRP
jgi:HPt (histidine-containing phosphotransfer) domain-containing protein